MTIGRSGTVATLLASLVLASACHKAPGDTTSGAAPSASSAVPKLPPLVFKDDTPNALLTWVDDQGDFHVTEHVGDVPGASREHVRVVLSDRKDGTGDTIYVADLRAKGPDGSYPVTTMTRDAWDEFGGSKRKERLEALAPSVVPPSGAAPGSSSGAPASSVSATIYGASWCGPCHQAEALLKSLGVHVTKLDIEESDDAERKMQEVLRRAHRQGGSIPVIDLMGQVFVGFSEGALRAAVARARSGQR